MLQSAVLFFFGHISLYVFGEAYGGVLDAYAELDISERKQKHFNLYLLQLRVSDFSLSGKQQIYMLFAWWGEIRNSDLH